MAATDSAGSKAATLRRAPLHQRLWRAVFWFVMGLLVLLTLAVAGALWWASSAGSLATVLRWAARYQPITAEQVSGSLVSGGRIGRLRWQQGTLSIEAQDVDVAWQAQAFFNQKIQLDRLSAAQLVIDDQGPPDPLKSRGPPESLMLPFGINIDALQIARLQWNGPPPVTVDGVAGHYQFDGKLHRLVLQSAQWEDGRYSGAATLTATGPLTLDAQVRAALQPALPGQNGPLPLLVLATATGPLTELAVRANLQRAAPVSGQTGPGVPAPSPSPQATAAARVMPWQSQPLRELDATFRNLNAAEFQSGLPQTQLTGKVVVRPVGSAAQLADQAWSLQANATNALAGPWDKKRLPVEQIEAAGEWKDGAAVLRTLQARLGSGTVRASGAWQPAPTAPAADTNVAVPTWQFKADIANLNPALLVSQMAAVPISGVAKASSAGPAINFDVNVKAAARQREPAGTPALLLSLREAMARGSWNPQRAGGTLSLAALRVATVDAQLSGQIDWQLGASGGAGKLALAAPGLDASVQGELRETRGGGDITLRASDAAQAARWLQQLPGLPTRVQTVLVSGRGSLTASWKGGWRDPTVHGKLEVPSLDWRRSTNAGAAGAAMPDDIKVRGLQASLQGKLSQAQFATQGLIEMGGRSLQLQAALAGGRVAPSSSASDAQKTAWRAANWRASVTQLELAFADPALSAGAWQLALRQPVDLTWTAARTATGAGVLASGAGEAVLRAPPRRASAPRATAKEATAPAAPNPPQATIAWAPVRVSGGELATAGKVTGLSMAWLELLAGPQLAAGGVTGDLLLEGEWNVALGDTLRVEASLGRVSGDLTLQAETAERTSARVAAGIRAARLSVQSTGNDITLALRWDSNRIGTATGQLATRLQRGPDGWTWPSDAPLNGQLRAQLPRIGVWSLFAPPGWRLRGAVSTDLLLRGTRETPSLTGPVEATDLALRSLADGIEFGDGTLRAQLDGTRLRIDEFTLRGAGEKGSGGRLTAQGEAGWINGRAQVQLNARLERLRASIRDDRQITVSGDLQASLQGLQTDIGGKIVIDQARIVLPEENTPQLGNDVVVRTTRGSATGQQAPALTSEAMAAPPAAPDSAGRTAKLAVQLDLGPDFRVTGKGLSTRLSGALALASAANPTSTTSASPGNLRLNGTINTVGGEYSAYGQRLAIERGLLRFTGAIDNPTLDILAIRPNIAQRVGLEILGTALLPRVRLYAQPELPDADKLSWLIIGRASGSGGAEAALLQQAAIALLGSKTGASSAGLASTFGLDELSFRGASSNSNGGATEAAVTLGKRFSQNFYAAYERSISGTVGTLFIFYELSRRFTLRGQAGQQSAIDLIYTLQFN